MKFVTVACLLLHCVYGAEDRYLSLPQKKECDKSELKVFKTSRKFANKNSLTGFMEGKYEGKNFFYTGHDPELKDVRLDWLGKLN